MKLGKTELLGVFNDHHGGIGDIDADFDDAGGHEALQFVLAEVAHHAVLCLGGEASVQEAGFERSEGQGEFVEFTLHGFHILVRVIFLYAGIDDVGLATFREFFRDKGEHLLELGRGADISADAATIARHLIDDGDIQIAVEREAQGARDGGGGHDEEMRILALAHERFALGHTELVLLVNDHEPDHLQAEGVLHQGMGADDEARAVVREESLATAGLELDGDLERFEPVFEISIMLFRQNLSGRHQENGEAALDGHQRGTGGDGGLAGTDVTLQQTTHGMLAAHIMTNLTQDFGLTFGELEAEFGEERFDEVIVPGAGQGDGVQLQPATTALDLLLQGDEFIQSESFAGDLGVFPFFREVEHVEGVAEFGEASLDRLGERLSEDRFILFQCAPDERAEPTLRETFGERVNGDDAVQVDGGFLARFDDFRLRMIHGARLERVRFAIDHDIVAIAKVILHEGEIPPAAMEPGGAVINDEFEDGLAAFGKSIQAHGNDLAANCGGSIEREIEDRQEMTAILITTRTMEQQVLNAVNAEPVQLSRALLANPVQVLDQRFQIERRIRHGERFTGQSVGNQAGIADSEG